MNTLTGTVERTECTHVTTGANEPMCGLSGFCVHQRAGAYLPTCSDPGANGPVDQQDVTDANTLDGYYEYLMGAVFTHMAIKFIS